MKLLIAGDFSPRYDLQKQIDLHNFQTIFDDVKYTIDQSDYSIVNFETTIADDKDHPILKSGPHLKTNYNAIEAIKYAGFKCVTLANNHFFDYGDSSVKKTISAIDESYLDRVGGGNNLEEASAVLYKDVVGETIALINACEHEFSIAEDEHGGCNPLDTINLFYAICEAKAKAKFIIVIIHGGHEHHKLPSPRMKKIYRYFIDAGADAVINHHQHCFSGYEVYNGKPIFYGLGNFCFPSQLQADEPTFWNYGYMVVLYLTDKNIDFEIIPYIQCFKNTSVELLKEKAQFLQEIEELNTIIQDDKLLEKHTVEFFFRNERKIQYVWEPYRGKILKALYYFHLLPSLVTNKGSKLTMLYNCLNCESHRDKMMCILKKCALK